MDVKPGYKLTEVGVIPEDWEVSTATDACDLIVDCKNRTPPIVADSDYAVVRTPNVRDGQFVLEDLRFTDETSYREWTARAVPQFGDIMITREAPLGEVCAVPSGWKVCLGQRMMLYRPSLTKTDSTYLLFSLMSLPVKANLLKKIGGSTVGHAKVDDIRFLQLPLPPLPEQRAIAKALSDVDALLTALDRLIAKKRDLKQAAMQQLLTGQTRLPGFTGEWATKTLGDVITHCFSGSTPRRNRLEYYKGNIRWITSTELNYNVITDTAEKITSEAVVHTNLTILPKGTFLMAITGLEAEGTRGACGIVGVPSTTNQSCMAIFPTSKLMTDYLFHYYVLRGKSLALQYCQGTKQQSYNAKLVKQLPIDLPPTIAEQTAIAGVLSDMDVELAALEQRRAKTRLLKQAMMQELLTGRTRLVG